MYISLLSSFISLGTGFPSYIYITSSFGSPWLHILISAPPLTPLFQAMQTFYLILTSLVCCLGVARCVNFPLLPKAARKWGTVDLMHGYMPTRYLEDCLESNITHYQGWDITQKRYEQHSNVLPRWCYIILIKLDKGTVWRGIDILTKYNALI